MAEFFEMGGYAQYVWPAYGIAALIMGALAVMIFRRNERARAELALLEARARRRPDEGPRRQEPGAQPFGLDEH